MRDELHLRETFLLFMLRKPETSPRKVARFIGISPEAVQGRLQRIYRKLGVHSRRDAWEVARKQYVLAEKVEDVATMANVARWGR